MQKIRLSVSILPETHSTLALLARRYGFKSPGALTVALLSLVCGQLKSRSQELTDDDNADDLTAESIQQHFASLGAWEAVSHDTPYSDD